MVAILSVLLTFILTIIVGGKIVQARQQDSWIAQKRFSGQEKEYFELKTLCDEIASSINGRVYAMRRLAFQLIAHAKNFDKDAMTDYKKMVKMWNEKISSYYVRLSQLGKTSYRFSLESEFHDPLRLVSTNIEEAASNPIHNVNQLRSIVAALDKANAAALRFNSALLSEVRKLRTKIYYPERIIFNRSNLYLFSTWQLIKAIFVSDVNRISVIRSPLNS